MLSDFLSGDQYEIMTARSGEEGLQKIWSGQPDLIITDVMMPRMTGYEMLQTLKKMGWTKKTPIIVMSAKTAFEDYFHSEPIYTFLPKPFNLDDLLNKIKLCLGPDEKPARVKPTYMGQELPSDLKIVLAGIDDYVVKKLVLYFESLDCQVHHALDEQKVAALTKEIHPDLVLSQYSESTMLLDAKKIYDLLLHEIYINPSLYAIYCDARLVSSAQSILPSNQILGYVTSEQLLQEVSRYLIHRYRKS